ncbi:MAG: hypothetical protein JXQ82_02225 [Methanomicrobiaceae archaeon]|nr:hypothetical protein [Methanomicrobiaceae archaeon]
MSDTFRSLAERAAHEKQIVRKSQFSKKICCAITAEKNLNEKNKRQECMIIC